MRKLLKIIRKVRLTVSHAHIEGRKTDNRALRMFGLKRVEVSGGWEKLHNKEHHDFYSYSK
jgi:hypothetical protein